MNNKEMTPEEKAEQELAALFKERMELELKRGNGVTLEKNKYIGDRTRDIEKELSQLKSKPKSDEE